MAPSGENPRKSRDGRHSRSAREWARFWPILADYFRSRRWRTAGKSLALLPAIFPCEAGLESLNPNSASRWPGILQADGREILRQKAEIPANKRPGMAGNFAAKIRKNLPGFRQTLANGFAPGRSWLIISDPAAGGLPGNLWLFFRQSSPARLDWNL